MRACACAPEDTLADLRLLLCERFFFECLFDDKEEDEEDDDDDDDESLSLLSFVSSFRECFLVLLDKTAGDEDLSRFSLFFEFLLLLLLLLSIAVLTCIVCVSMTSIGLSIFFASLGGL